MRDFSGSRDAFRRFGRGLSVLVLAGTACVESSPVEPAVAETESVAESEPVQRIDDARASLEDALARVLPTLEDGAETHALREAIETLARALAGDDAETGRAELVRAQAFVEAHPGANAGLAPELDALSLALSVAQRVLVGEPRR
ncbi:MAG: hypothetical protein ACREMQ_18860 [Longimicrobiales bacterium]